ncbi:helix-turn-helix transcriptional regulator [Maribellus sp. YY47]|uniref:helix-turn-helix domain-containing protein n=1 Tax=Maribellus sp. YY47 TaxID=2929486 RepID=UPI002001A3BC|nr:helix-turn-helix transcriptional regulator [Maribellus sp. YY47]MCK3685912.1 helix-turn-helix transcriptional regulator [Maribellus sp. YY47]
MSDFIDHRDKPETEQHQNFHLSDNTSFFERENVQKLVCLSSKADGRIICLADVPGAEGQSFFRKKNCDTVSEVEEQAFLDIWNELQRLSRLSKEKKRNCAGEDFVLVFDIVSHAMKKEEVRNFWKAKKHFTPRVGVMIDPFNGKIIDNGGERYCISFESSKDAIRCASFLKDSFFESLDSGLQTKISFKVGLSQGHRSGYENGSNALVLKRSERLCHVAREKILVSSDCKDGSEPENGNAPVEIDGIEVLSAEDERFVHKLLDCMERKWQDESFFVDEFSKQLSSSKSHIYRKMISLLGLSPNNFIREYRLGKSIDLLNKTTSNIAEVAFEAGFSSPSYFTKCFQLRYGVTPSEYLQIMGE